MALVFFVHFVEIVVAYQSTEIEVNFEELRHTAIARVANWIAKRVLVC
jgi:hypothetical protein